jgi:hypothetical protein
MLFLGRRVTRSPGLPEKLGSLQPWIDLVRDNLPQRDWRRLDGRDFHRCQLESGFDEGLKREHTIREERVAKCFVCDESSDQNLDAAVCHADRLSRSASGKRNASNCGGTRHARKRLTMRALRRIASRGPFSAPPTTCEGNRQVVDGDRQGVDALLQAVAFEFDVELRACQTERFRGLRFIEAGGVQRSFNDRPLSRPQIR